MLRQLLFAPGVFGLVGVAMGRTEPGFACLIGWVLGLVVIAVVREVA